MEQIRIIIGIIVSSVLTLFTPIKDVMLAMLVLFSINGAMGLLEDILHASGWKTKKALSFLGQCAIYFGTIMSLFLIGHLVHEHDEAMTCVKFISIITVWVSGVNFLRNARSCCPESSSMYRLFDILYYVASVQVVEKIPFVQKYYLIIIIIEIASRILIDKVKEFEGLRLRAYRESGGKRTDGFRFEEVANEYQLYAAGIE